MATRYLARLVRNTPIAAQAPKGGQKAGLDCVRIGSQVPEAGSASVTGSVVSSSEPQTGSIGSGSKEAEDVVGSTGPSAGSKWCGPGLPASPVLMLAVDGQRLVGDVNLP